MARYSSDEDDASSATMFSRYHNSTNEELEHEKFIHTSDDEDERLHHLTPRPSSTSWLLRRAQALMPTRFVAYHRLPHISRRSSVSTWLHRLVACLVLLPLLFAIIIISTGILLPSYTHAPAHYSLLKKRVAESELLGRANMNNEKVFIAASIYDKDGELVSGAWGEAILGLVDILGPDNVFLSIYENDPDPQAQNALDQFSPRLACNSSLIYEHLDTHDVPHVTVPSGEQYVSRLAFLAEVRNRALRPLEDPRSSASHVRFDKVLYINDVVFDPTDAANLLFSTNVDEHGKAQYRAACAADFINPFKYYDTFATRDLEGYPLGIPFYPWFTNAGNADSRNDVLGQTDAVRVRSCWGGMVAFDAQFFQADLLVSTAEEAPSSISTATHSREGPDWHSATAYSGTFDDVSREEHSTRNVERFRSDFDPFWEASECCLIHADIQEPRGDNVSAPTGIYLNPYIRVAYDSKTLAWLGFTRRFERLYAGVHRLLNWALDLPRFNPRRTEEAGQLVVDRVFVYDFDEWNTTGVGAGSYQDVERIALPGEFCGSRMLLALPEGSSGGHWFHQKAPFDEGDPTGKGVPVRTKNVS